MTCGQSIAWGGVRAPVLGLDRLELHAQATRCVRACAAAVPGLDGVSSAGEDGVGGSGLGPVNRGLQDARARGSEGEA